MTAKRPYPGIRPIDAEEGNLLEGRQADIQSMFDFMSENRPLLVEMSGPSGVGKSSFLRAGLVPRLRSSGWRVLYIGDWDGFPFGDDAEGNPYSTVVDRALRMEAAAGRTWASSYDGTGGLSLLRSSRLRTLLILDQFEEVIRVDRVAARRLLGEAAAVVHGDGSFWHIVSFRSEYKYELSEMVERVLPSSSWTYVPIGPIAVRDIERVIVEPLTKVGGGGARASNEFIEVVMRAWEGLVAAENARAGQHFGDGRSSPGLLHLQALLTVIWHSAQEKARGGEVVLEPGLVPTLAGGDAADLFGWGLREYLHLRLDVAPSRYVGSGASDRERRAILHTAALIAPSLWSGGFKVLQNADSLAWSALPRMRDLGAKRMTPEAIKVAALAAAELGPGLNGMNAGMLIERMKDDLLQLGDPDSTAGAAAAWSPAHVVCEMLVSYERALDLLKSEAVVRVTSGGFGRIVSLTHDVLGPALLDWKEDIGAAPWVEIDSEAAISGEQVLGDVLEPDPADESRWRPTLDGQVYGSLEGVRWIGCQITARFKSIALRDCWFDGSVFNQCVFEDVRFEDCRMWGAIFVDCEFIGSKDVAFIGNHTDVRTLTFLARPGFTRRCLAFSPGGRLVFRDLVGYGLFIRRVSGGPIEVEGGRLDHVSLEGRDGQPLGPVRISDGHVRHIEIGPAVLRPIALDGNTRAEFVDADEVNLTEVFSLTQFAEVHAARRPSR